MVHIFATRIYWIVAVLLLLAGPVVGVVTKHFVAQNEHAKAQSVFKEHLTKQVFLLEKQIGVFTEVLAGLRSFFESSETVTREEFARFTKDSLARYPAIQALEWVPMVDEEWRRTHEDQARIPGLEPYRITTLTADGALVPAPQKDVYFPVHYVEPVAGNESVFGYDLSSEETRRLAIISAIARPGAVLSDPVNLVQARGRKADVLMFLRVPLFPDPDAELHAGGCHGLVLLVLKLDGLIKSTLLADAYLDSASYGFELVDVDVAGSTAVLYSHPEATGEAVGSANEVELAIETGGQSWRLVAKPLAPFLERHATVNPVVVGIGAAAVWELIWLALIALSNWSKTNIVNRQRRILDSVLASMADAVVVADDQGGVVLTNQAAALLLGDHAEMRAQDVAALKSLCKLSDQTSAIPDDGFPLTEAIQGKQVRDSVLWIPASSPATRGAWVSANASPLLSSDGSHHGGVLVLRDITERKQSIELSKWLRSAVEQTDDTVFITDRSGVIQYVNAAFERTTGFTRAEALGQTPRILKSHLNQPKHYRELWSTILRGEVFRRVIINRKKSGEIYYADQTITPMRDLNGKVSHFVAVVKDMTEYRQARQREVEMDIAVKVQQRLFPLCPPPLEHLDIAGAVFAADSIGGDYFDYIPMSGNRVCLAIGDVSGHGIGSAMVMAEARAFARSMSPDEHSPGEILSRVNWNLFQDLNDSHFVTLVLAYVDADAHRLVYASAGHDSCFLLDRDGQVKHELSSTGLPLGMFDTSEYSTSREVGFEAGDILVLLTDGLADCLAHQDKFLDIQKCLALIHRYRHEPAKVIIDEVNHHVRDFMGGERQSDDITIVICKAEH